MKISKELKVGVVSIFAIAILVWGFNYLKGTNLFVKGKSVYAIYPAVTGLSVSAPIIINGVQSGVVEAIYFHPNKSSEVIVKLRITESALEIKADAIANLISTDFLGTKAIGLTLGDSIVLLQDGDTITSHYEKSAVDNVTEQILPIKNKAENLVDSLQTAINSFNTIMAGLGEVFDDKNKRNLTAALSNFNTTIKSFNGLANNLNSTLNTSVKPTMSKYQDLADSLAQLDINATLLKAQSTMDGITMVMERMNKGEGTMGQLMTNDSLYHSLNSAANEMQELMEDIKLHPKRYFRVLSRKEIPYEKPNN